MVTVAMVNYFKNNYCARCELSYPKILLRCLECHKKLRTSMKSSKKKRKGLVISYSTV